MAEAVLKKLEEQVKCSICLDIFTNPKLLQCHHVFCQKCLTGQAGHVGRWGRPIITCSICRKDTTISAGGVEGLQTAFRIIDLLGIRDSMKTVVEDEPPSSASASNFCPVHKKELELYCETCKEVLCLKCVFSGGRHYQHNYLELDQSFEKFKKEMLPSLKKLCSTVEESLENIAFHQEHIPFEQSGIEFEINAAIDELHAALDVRREELLKQLQEISEMKVRVFSAQEASLKTVQDQLKGSLDIIQNEDPVEALKMRTLMEMQLKEFRSRMPLTHHRHLSLPPWCVEPAPPLRNSSRPRASHLLVDASAIFLPTRDYLSL